MKFWEAMKALEEGKKVMRLSYVYDKRSFADAVTYCGTEMEFIRDWMDLEWELYEEPEQFLSFADVVNGWKEGKAFKRLDRGEMSQKRQKEPKNELEGVGSMFAQWERAYGPKRAGELVREYNDILEKQKKLVLRSLARKL